MKGSRFSLVHAQSWGFVAGEEYLDEPEGQSMHIDHAETYLKAEELLHHYAMTGIGHHRFGPGVLTIMDNERAERCGPLVEPQPLKLADAA